MNREEMLFKQREKVVTRLVQLLEENKELQELYERLANNNEDDTYITKLFILRDQETVYRELIKMYYDKEIEDE